MTCGQTDYLGVYQKEGRQKTEKYTGLGRMMVLKLPKERKVANIAVVVSS